MIVQLSPPPILAEHAREMDSFSFQQASDFMGRNGRISVDMETVAGSVHTSNCSFSGFGLGRNISRHLVLEAIGL